jgi:hypothetical protein
MTKHVILIFLKNIAVSQKFLCLTTLLLKISSFGASERVTSRKKGFHSLPLVPKLFGPWLKGALVPVQFQMWDSEH